jgi:hypothetical protein
MDFHRARVDVRLEGVVGVRERREFVSHDFSWFGLKE